ALFSGSSSQDGRSKQRPYMTAAIMHTDFKNKTIAVIGLARSGLACCEVLTQLGARVIPYDGKPAAEIAEAVAEIAALGLTPLTGGAALDYSALDYLVTSPGVRRDAPVLQNAVAAGVPVLGEIEAAYRIARAPILAITGTNGKTTTTVLLGEMLKAAGIETYIAGNIAAGDIAMPLIKAAHLAPPEAAIVAEISSFQLEWISTFRPKVAALLNISPDHGDRQTWAEYVAAKWRIFENQTRDDFAIVNEEISADIPLHKVDASIWALGGEPDIRQVYVQGLLVIVEGGPGGLWSELFAISEVKLPGAHNIENILAAAAMATAFGVGIEPIRQAATTFTGVVHRLEYVGTIGGVRYVNNSMCTNAAAFEKSLEALPEPKVVIAGGVFKGGDVAELGKAVVQNNVRALVLIGRSAPEIEQAARAAGYANVHRAGTLQDAVTQAATLALPGDTVLLAPACASFDMFKDFEDRGEQFKAAVRGL
ncbi:MAG: UDP-N-acetylmuramoyl-L-alanine--D-glutamate ligase, partial [Armatimonadota bacterium]|nr:UDP-N-acetylmuramoyl-L-alanine--D-glutamate ligase [Armatimonadota bacterium]